MSSSSLPTVPRGRGSGGNLVTPDSRSGVPRASPSPSGTRSAPASVANRQPGRSTPLKTTRLSRSQQGREQRGESESNDDMSIQELRDVLNVREAEILRLQAESRQYEFSIAESNRESESLRQDLEDALLEQHRLEDELELRRQEIEQKDIRIRESAKYQHDLEKLAESEQERLLQDNRAIMKSNNELTAQLTALRNSLQNDRSRNVAVSKEVEPTDTESLVSISIVREKDRQLELLQLELADLEVRLAEQQNAALSRSRQIEDALLQAKLENIRLTENVESYQMLLQDRTLKGEYSIMNLEGLSERDETDSIHSDPPSDGDRTYMGTTSLAAELEEAETVSDTSRIKLLQAEIRHLKDSNKAMTLYINEIIGRLLQTKGFEHVLEKDVNKPLPVPEWRSSQGRTSIEATSRKGLASEIATPVHRRMSSEAGISGGLSRAFSFRKKPDSSKTIPNLRPLKLVEEQQPHASLRSDGTLHYARPRTRTDDEPESVDTKTAKRASWVPGWFAKAGVVPSEEK